MAENRGVLGKMESSATPAEGSQHEEKLGDPKERHSWYRGYK